MLVGLFWKWCWTRIQCSESIGSTLWKRVYYPQAIEQGNNKKYVFSILKNKCNFFLNFNSQKEEELFQLSERSKQTLSKVPTVKFCQLTRDSEVDVNCSFYLNGFTLLMLHCSFNKCPFPPDCFTALMQNKTTNVTIIDGEGSNALHLLIQKSKERNGGCHQAIGSARDRCQISRLIRL